MKQTTHNTPFFLWGFLLLGALTLDTSCGAQMSEYTKETSAGINGGFETARNNLPVNWYLYTSRTVKNGNFTLGLETQDVAEGKQSLVFTVKECSDKVGRFSPGFFNEFDVISGGTYRIRFKVKNEGATVAVSIKAVSATKGGEAKQELIANTKGIWQEVSYEYKVPDNFARIRFELNILSAGTVKVDDFSIVSVTPQP
jgi:hypothetical protein